MELLTDVRHIYNTVALELLCPVAQRGHISRVIVEPTVRLANYQRNFVFGNKNTNGTIVLDRNLLFEKFVDHASEHWVIEGLPNFF